LSVGLDAPFTYGWTVSQRATVVAGRRTCRSIRTPDAQFVATAVGDGDERLMGEVSARPKHAGGSGRMARGGGKLAANVRPILDFLRALDEPK
jgi:hypothetical protein